jgi:hypothetical protein
MPKSTKTHKRDEDSVISLTHEINKDKAPRIIYLPSFGKYKRYSQNRMTEIEISNDEKREQFVTLDVSKGTMETGIKEIREQLAKIGKSNVNQMKIVAPASKKNKAVWNLIKDVLSGQDIPAWGWAPQYVIVHDDQYEPIGQLIEGHFDNYIECTYWAFKN